MTESLELDVLSNASTIKAYSCNSTDPTVLIGAQSMCGGNITCEFCAMVMFLDCFDCQSLLVSSPPLT